MRSSVHLKTLLAVCVLIVSLAACSSSPNRESTGQYIDSAAITTKVKAAIFDEPTLKSTQVSVTTVQDVVQLSGFVDTASNKSKAGELARKVDGVRSVQNDLIVR